MTLINLRAHITKIFTQNVSSCYRYFYLANKQLRRRASLKLACVSLNVDKFALKEANDQHKQYLNLSNVSSKTGSIHIYLDVSVLEGAMLTIIHHEIGAGAAARLTALAPAVLSLSLSHFSRE